MVAQAAMLADSGSAENVLVVAGEDRASGQSSRTSTGTLAQVGHPTHEAPVGATIPAYYALLASVYLHRYGLDPAAGLAPFAVQMRDHAAARPGGHFRRPINTADVIASRPVADPLRLLDCCPMSDGGAALLVTRSARSGRDAQIIGLGQAHQHQHLTEADMDDLGARRSARRALVDAHLGLSDVDLFGIYDSFTITAALLIEEIGIAEPGTCGAAAASGHFAVDGPTPVNPHGGLLSYGHCGVAGGMAHLAEAVAQLRGEATGAQVPGRPQHALVHADGGVLSAHVSVVLRAGVAR
jgi:acetyl-CoA acetyltransferase